MRKWPPLAGALGAAGGWAVYNGQAPKPQGFGKSFVETPGDAAIRSRR
jgi:hypothetical protein